MMQFLLDASALFGLILDLTFRFAGLAIFIWIAWKCRPLLKELFVACTSVFRGKKKASEVSVDSPEKES